MAKAKYSRYCGPDCVRKAATANLANVWGARLRYKYIGKVRANRKLRANKLRRSGPKFVPSLYNFNFNTPRYGYTSTSRVKNKKKKNKTPEDYAKKRARKKAAEKAAKEAAKRAAEDAAAREFLEQAEKDWAKERARLKALKLAADKANKLAELQKRASEMSPIRTRAGARKVPGPTLADSLDNMALTSPAPRTPNILATMVTDASEPMSEEKASRSARKHLRFDTLADAQTNEQARAKTLTLGTTSILATIIETENTSTSKDVGPS